MVNILIDQMSNLLDNSDYGDTDDRNGDSSNYIIDDFDDTNDYDYDDHDNVQNDNIHT